MFILNTMSLLRHSFRLISTRPSRSLSLGNRRLQEKQENSSTSGTVEAVPTTPEEQPNKDAIIAQKDEDLKELKDKYLRALADTQNVRNRLTLEVEKSKVFGITKFAKDVVEIADILEMASKAITPEILKTASADPNFKTLHEGLISIQHIFEKNLAKNGVVAYAAVNDVFDPNLHDAQFEVHDPSKVSGTLAHIIKRGYKLNERVLRPASVGVVGWKKAE